MPPAVTRELSVTYAGFTVGGASDAAQLHGLLNLSRGYDTSTLTFQAIVIGSTEAEFRSRVVALEDAFRTPRQLTIVTLGGQTLLTWSHVSNTGFNSDPESTKVGVEGYDSGRSRLYDISITVTEPADLSGQAGRRDSSVQLNLDGSRVRTVTISGQYTALGSNDARAQYDASIAAYQTAVMSGLSITEFEIIDESASNDDDDKILDFSRTLREIIFAQSGSATNDTRLVNHQVAFARSLPNAGSSDPNVSQLATVTGHYEANVDVTVTTDLRSLWEDVVRPYVLEQARTQFGDGTIGVVGDDVRFERATNRIIVDLTLLVTTGSNVLTFIQTETVEDDKGRLIIPVWDGGVLDAYVFQGPRTLTRSVVVIKRILAGGGAAGGAGGGGGGGGGGAIRAGVINRPGIGIGGADSISGQTGGLFGIFPSSSGVRRGVRITWPNEAAGGDGTGGDEAGGGGAPGGGVDADPTEWVKIRESHQSTPLVLGAPGNQIQVEDVRDEVAFRGVNRVGAPPIGAAD